MSVRIYRFWVKQEGDDNDPSDKFVAYDYAGDSHEDIIRWAEHKHPGLKA